MTNSFRANAIDFSEVQLSLFVDFRRKEKNLRRDWRRLQRRRRRRLEGFYFGTNKQGVADWS